MAVVGVLRPARPECEQVRALLLEARVVEPRVSQCDWEGSGTGGRDGARAVAIAEARVIRG